MRGERAEVSSRLKRKSRTVVGRGEKSLICDPESELRLGAREKRRANKLNDMGGGNIQNQIGCQKQCIPLYLHSIFGPDYYDI